MKQLDTKLKSLAVLASLLVAGCSDEPLVSFSKDVFPIIQQNCLECHKVGGKGQQKSGLNLETYADAMKGTKFGPVIEAGNSVSSTLVILVEGRADPSIKMPHSNKQALKGEEIAVIRRWIDQGAQNN